MSISEQLRAIAVARANSPVEDQAPVEVERTTRAQPDVARPLPPHREAGKRPAASASYAALQPPAKVHLVGFPLRLSTESVDQLNTWKTAKGIVPGLLVREMVEKGIADLQQAFAKESAQ